jgi:hypothetical protein
MLAVGRQHRQSPIARHFSRHATGFAVLSVAAGAGFESSLSPVSEGDRVARRESLSEPIAFLWLKRRGAASWASPTLVRALISSVADSLTYLGTAAQAGRDR